MFVYIFCLGKGKQEFVCDFFRTYSYFSVLSMLIKKNFYFEYSSLIIKGTVERRIKENGQNGSSRGRHMKIFYVTIKLVLYQSPK